MLPGLIGIDLCFVAHIPIVGVKVRGPPTPKSIPSYMEQGPRGAETIISDH